MNILSRVHTTDYLIYNTSMAITKILIREHYWLNDMEIDCVNSATGKPYKCIILAGENGTGKSTLFNLLLTKQMNNIYYPDSNSTDSTGIIIECDAYTIFYKIEEQQSEVAGSSVSNIRMNNINNLEYPVKNILNGLIRNMETESLKKIKEYSNTSKTAREVMDEIQSPLLIFQKYFDIFFKDSNLTMEINYTTLQVNFKRNGKFFNIENLSDGEKRILSFSGKLIASGKDITDSVIIIDEPDDKLHFK
jgi:ATPase subunit of ABC transporter with duplicated ATPase domains